MYYRKIIDDADSVSYSAAIKDTFGDSVILNNYEDFIKRTCCLIIGKQKK